MRNILEYFKNIINKLSLSHYQFKFSDSTFLALDNAEKQSDLFRVEIEKYKNTKVTQWATYELSN